MKIKVAIIIPCFNEQDNITGVIDDVLNNAPANEEWHPIAINDCSTDETLTRLREGRKSNNSGSAVQFRCWSRGSNRLQIRLGK